MHTYRSRRFHGLFRRPRDRPAGCRDWAWKSRTEIAVRRPAHVADGRAPTMDGAATGVTRAPPQGDTSRHRCSERSDCCCRADNDELDLLGLSPHPSEQSHSGPHWQSDLLPSMLLDEVQAELRSMVHVVAKKKRPINGRSGGIHGAADNVMAPEGKKKRKKEGLCFVRDECTN